MKIAIFDADGTILHLSKGLAPKVKDAFRLLNEQGVLLVLCTSRSEAFVPDYLQKIEFDAMITSNGASVKYLNNRILDKTILHSNVIEILDILYKGKLIPVLCGNQYVMYDDSVLTDAVDEWVGYVKKELGNHWLHIKYFSIDKSINKICVKVPLNVKCSDIITEIKKRYDVLISISIDEITGECTEFEIVPAGCTKGTGVEFLLEHVGISSDNAIAFGDSISDIDMFRSVGISVAMGNASVEVKNASTFITGQFDNGGVYDACDYLGIFTGNRTDISELNRLAYEELLKITDVSSLGILGYERFLIIDKAKWFDAFLQGKVFPPIQIDWQLNSVCNLNCRWCVGQVSNKRNNGFTLPNTTSLDDISKIANEISKLSMNNIRVETVQFSGFTGEPLLNWNKLSRAIQLLHDNKIRIGIFTNGTLMDEKTWEELIQLKSVHVSIDGGISSWSKIKCPNDKRVGYDTVIRNLSGLCETRKRRKTECEINTGYTITLDNYLDLESVISDIKNAGADSICIKWDITGTDFSGTFEDAITITRLVTECVNKYNTSSFSVLVMEDNSKLSKNRWSCKDGCYYRYFFCTIGSDANIYPCDYQTLKTCPSFGSCKDNRLEDLCKNKDEQWDKKVQSREFQNICPPLAEVINPYLSATIRLKNKYGEKAILLAFERIREEYR